MDDGSSTLLVAGGAAIAALACGCAGGHQLAARSAAESGRQKLQPLATAGEPATAPGDAPREPPGPVIAPESSCEGFGGIGDGAMEWVLPSGELYAGTSFVLRINGATTPAGEEPNGGCSSSLYQQGDFVALVEAGAPDRDIEFVNSWYRVTPQRLSDGFHWCVRALRIVRLCECTCDMRLCSGGLIYCSLHTRWRNGCWPWHAGASRPGLDCGPAPPRTRPRAKPRLLR